MEYHHRIPYRSTPAPARRQDFVAKPMPIVVADDDYAAYYAELLSHLEPVKGMEKHGYVSHQFTDAELDQKRRCKYCHQTILNLTKNLKKTLTYRLEKPVPRPPAQVYEPLPNICVPGNPVLQPCTTPCKYHPGEKDLFNKVYTCCNQHFSAEPCASFAVHYLLEYAPGELQSLYQYYETPPVYPHGIRQIRPAVCIDCEMGTAKSGDTELIRLSAIDYFTGEVLINNIVDPDQPMEHLNTRYSGVTWGEMNYAVRKKICLKGKQGAREALWRFVGPDTILMGHSVSNDLRSLRWIHPRIVDSFFIEFKIVQAKRAIEAAAAKEAAEKAAEKAAEEKAREIEEKLRELEISGKAVVISDEQAAADTPKPRPSEPKQKKPKGSGDLALKSLLKKYLDRDVQMQGKKGHDSLEDAISARDLVHFMVTRSMMEKIQGDALGVQASLV